MTLNIEEKILLDEKVACCLQSLDCSLHANFSFLNTNKPNLFLQPSQHKTLIIEEFEPDVFRQLIEYIHTGAVTLQPRTLLGELFRTILFLLV